METIILCILINMLFIKDDDQQEFRDNSPGKHISGGTDFTAIKFVLL